MANFSWLLKIRKVMTKITDLLLKGREAGLWQEGHGPTSKGSDLNRPGGLGR